MPVLSNHRWELFAQELSKGVPAITAYISAGYLKNDSNASRLNGNDKVRARVDELLAIGAKKAGITVQRIVNELAKIGFSDIRKAVTWGTDISIKDENGIAQIVSGIAMINSDALDADTAACISEVSQTKEGIKIKFHDKRAALVDLGRHLKMFTDKTEHSGSLTISHEEALKELE